MREQAPASRQAAVDDQIQVHVEGTVPDALDIPRELQRDLARACLAVAAADGELSDDELARCLARLRMLGADDALLADCRADARRIGLDDLAPMSLQPHARATVYAVVKVARADGLAATERAAAFALAQRLGLHAGFVSAVEAFHAVEDAARACRVGWLWQGGGAPDELDGRDANDALPEDDVSVHVRRERYGLERPISDDWLGRLGSVVLAVAAGDGAVGARERARLLALWRMLGASRETLADLGALDPRTLDVTSLVDKRMRPLARIVLLDAVEVCAADGMANAERAASRRAAAFLGLPPSVVPEVESVVNLAWGLRESRRRLLAPPPR